MKQILIIALMVATTATSFAQGRGFQRPDREQLQAARIAFLTNRLDLDTEQAKVFWPIFNEYEKEKETLIKSYNQQKRRLAAKDGFRNISDEDADKMIEIYLEQKTAQLELEKKYLVRFKEVLDAKQTWALVRFESEFRREVAGKIMNRARERRGKGNGGPGDGNQKPAGGN